MSLDLNMGYYHILLSEQAKPMYYYHTMGKVLVQTPTNGG